MNKTIAITAIVLVAVVMGMSAIVPMLPEAFAHDVPTRAFEKAHKICDEIPSPISATASEIICNHGED